MEFLSRGGGGTGPHPKTKIEKKKSRRKTLLSGSRSQVLPRRAALELCTKLGSQTQTRHELIGVHVGVGPEFRWECLEVFFSDVIFFWVVIGSPATRSISSGSFF